MKFKRIKFGKYFFDFVSVFFAVIAAFALNNWNENRRDALAEQKILMEIRNGLHADLDDFNENKEAYEAGIRSCDFFGRLFDGDIVNQDSVQINYLYLTAGSMTVINTSGYESLKSKGLEIVQNDSVRIKIIELYETYYQALIKMEEVNPMSNIFNTYYSSINKTLSPYMVYDSKKNNQMSLSEPVQITSAEQKLMASYIWRIRFTRQLIINYFVRAEDKILELIEEINTELEK